MEKDQVVFNYRKAKAAKEFGNPPKSLKISSAWQQGPWYYVYLKPNWVLKTAGVPGEESSFDHADYWITLVDMVVAPFYKIKDPKIIAELKNMPYCMPRGRVVYRKVMGGNREWVAYHGADFNYSITEKKKKIASAFNLLPMLYEGRMRFALDDHHLIQAHDFQKFNSMVTQVNMKNVQLVEPVLD